MAGSVPPSTTASRVQLYCCSARGVKDTCRQGGTGDRLVGGALVAWTKLGSSPITQHLHPSTHQLRTSEAGGVGWPPAQASPS